MKLYNIRWKDSELDLLKRKVNNYNAKIRRLEKKGVDERFIPSKLSFKDVKKKIVHREDLKPELDIIDAFLKRGSETRFKKTKRGAVIPEFREKEIKIKKRIINRDRKREQSRYDKMEVTDRNVGQGQSRGEYKSDTLPHLGNKKFNPEYMSQKDLEKYMESLKEYEIQQEEKDLLYVFNLYKSLQNVLPEDRFNEIADVLDKILEEEGPKKIVEKYYTDLNMRIDFYYEKIDADVKWDAIIESWSSILME